MSGGFNPSPRRTGASSGTLLEVLLDSIMEGVGTGLSDDVDAFAYAEAYAEARALADLFRATQRLAYQWDPLRMTDFLPRWEGIYGIVPPKSSTENERRAVVGARMALEGVAPTIQAVRDYLAAILGALFVQVNHSTAATARVTFPGGITFPGGVVAADDPFASTVAYVDVELAQPAGMSDQEFYDRAGQIYGPLDTFLPGWVDFNWSRCLGGHPDCGFYLDDDLNLDNEHFE